MKRRGFISGMSLLLLGTQVRAEGPGARALPYAANPGLGKILLERYDAYHKKEFFDFKWTPAFNEALRTAYAEPRDLSPPVSGSWRWPRFQWEHRYDRGTYSSQFHWFDFESPQDLRAIWQSKMKAPAGNWCGISYDGKNFVTYARIENIDRLGFEKWGLQSSNGEITRFSKSGDLCEILRNDALIATRRFDAERLNPAPGTKEYALIRKVFDEFMMMPSSGTMLADVRLHGMFYP